MNNLKRYLPHAVLAILVLIGGYLLVHGPGQGPKAVEGEPTSTTTEAMPEDPAAEGIASQGGLIPGLPAGVKIEKQTIWATFSDSAWDITFKYQTGWDFKGTYDTGGAIEQVYLSAIEGTILVSRETPIAEPKLIEMTTSTKTIAGQEIEVHEYKNPKEGYAYYQYFSVTDGNDRYYISIRSRVAEEKWVNDFVSRIQMK